MFNQTEVWLRVLGKSGIPEKYKAWGYQHGVRCRAKSGEKYGNSSK